MSGLLTSLTSRALLRASPSRHFLACADVRRVQGHLCDGWRVLHGYPGRLCPPPPRHRGRDPTSHPLRSFLRWRVAPARHSLCLLCAGRVLPPMACRDGQGNHPARRASEAPHMPCSLPRRRGHTPYHLRRLVWCVGIRSRYRASRRKVTVWAAKSGRSATYPASHQCIACGLL